jgi:hypothetical protein
MRLRITLLLARLARPRRRPTISASSAGSDRNSTENRRAPGRRNGLSSPALASSSVLEHGTLGRPRLTAWRWFLVGRRLHLTMGRSACRVLPTSTSREVRTTADASCTGRARHHRGLARRYGDRAFCNCDNPARRWCCCLFTRGARKARLHRRQGIPPPTAAWHWSRYWR